MFERFTEESRRALFFARLAVHEHGGTSIESEHVLIGLLRAAPATLSRCVNSEFSVESALDRAQATLVGGPRLATSVELPFSEPVKGVLRGAVAEADGFDDTQVRPEHLLLTLLGQEGSAAGNMLRDLGVDRQTIVENLRSKSRAEVPPA